MASDFPEYMTTSEAEEYCRLGGFAKRRVTGNGPEFLKIGSRVLYTRAALDAWLTARVYRNTSEFSAVQAITDVAASQAERMRNQTTEHRAAATHSRPDDAAMCVGPPVDSTAEADVRQTRPIDFRRINAAALASFPDLLRQWLPDGRRHGAEYVARNPRRDDRSPGSLKVNLINGRWADFALPDARGGDPVSLYAYLFRVQQSDAAREIVLLLGVGL